VEEPFLFCCRIIHSSPSCSLVLGGSNLFLQYAKKTKDDDKWGPYLNLKRIRLLLESAGERPDNDTL
jgi:hypothetical protein